MLIQRFQAIILLVALAELTHGFVAPATKSAAALPSCRQRMARKIDDINEDEKKGLIRSVADTWGQRRDRSDDKPKQDDDSNKGEGFFRGITKRLPRRNGDEAVNGDSISELPPVRTVPNPQPIKLVSEAFENIDGLRKQVSSVRSAEYLEEAVRLGILLAPEEEERRLARLRGQLESNRKSQVQLKKARKEIQKEAALTREQSRKDGLLKARERLEAKIDRSNKQRELYERQQKLVQIASGKTPRGNTNGRVAGLFSPFKGRSSNETATIIPAEKEDKKRKGKENKKRNQEKKRKRKQEKESSVEPDRIRKNVRSVPQNMFSGMRNETSEQQEESKKAESWAPQRFVSNMWETTFGAAKREQWVVAFPKSRIDPGELVPINVAGIDLLVVASRDGRKIYCIANSCSHLGTPLETGAMERRPVNGAAGSTDGGDSCTEEDCIVCPLHQTAFSLESGEVNGEWCPYPPVLGKMMGSVKSKSSMAVFDIRTKGKNIEIKINSRLDADLLYKDLGDD